MKTKETFEEIVNEYDTVKIIEELANQYQAIHHPAHYTSSKAKCECGRTIECIDVTRHMGFSLGNVIKYLWRHEQKNGLEDLKKARWYLDDLINMKEGKK